MASPRRSVQELRARRAIRAVLHGHRSGRRLKRQRSHPARQHWPIIGPCNPCSSLHGALDRSCDLNDLRLAPPVPVGPPPFVRALHGGRHVTLGLVDLLGIPAKLGRGRLVPGVPPPLAAAVDPDDPCVPSTLLGIVDRRVSRVPGSEISDARPPVARGLRSSGAKSAMSRAIVSVLANDSTGHTNLTLH